MIEPSFTDLMKKVDSRYSLVIGVAKRAREITAGQEPVVSCKNTKAVDIATCEIAAGKVLLYNESEQFSGVPQSSAQNDRCLHDLEDVGEDAHPSDADTDTEQ